MDDVSQSEAVIEKPLTAQRKKRVFTEQEEKDVSNVDVIQTKVSIQLYKIHLVQRPDSVLYLTKFK